MSPLQTHAAQCAALHICTTPDYAAAILRIPREQASAALREGVRSGLLRRYLLPTLGNTPVYQPSAFAGGYLARRAPRFLRAGLTHASCWRGVLRGAVVATIPDLEFLTADELSDTCAAHAIAERGHAAPLMGVDENGRMHLYVPVAPSLAARSPAGVITSAASRWMPLLEQEGAQLHFVTTVGRAGDAMRRALIELGPATSRDEAHQQLAALNARIAADPTGLVRIELAHECAELAAKVADAAADRFPWLARELVEVQL